MIAAGVRAHLVCVDPRHLDPPSPAASLTKRCSIDLPASVDPCGERGEFHTFVSAGPMLLPAEARVASKYASATRSSATDLASLYADLLPASVPSHPS